MKAIHYLSPSSFEEWLTCKTKFVRKRLMGYPKGADTQGIPAAMGCAFDFYVKRNIGYKLGLVNIDDDSKTRPDLQQTTLIKEITNDEVRAEIMIAAQELASRYIKLGLRDRLMNEQVVDIETDRFHIMPSGKEGIPDLRLYGKLDSVIAHPADVEIDALCPHDWKIRGYGSKTGYSPTPGYRNYLTHTGETKEIHIKCRSPIHELHEKWARQLTIYAWMINNITDPYCDLPVAIDEITYGKNSIAFTQIRTITTLQFQLDLLKQLQAAWIEIHELNSVPPGQPGYCCKQYNMLCEVAHLCPEFIQLSESKYAGII